MPKDNKKQQIAQSEPVEQPKQDMTLEEAKAYRASLHKPAPVVFNEQDRKEQFRIFWAREKSKYGRPKELEKALWLHLKSIGMDSQEQFEAGLQHFGLKKIRK
jgi:hypothetical protein